MVFNTNIMLANVYGRLSAAGPSAAGPSATIEHSSIYIYIYTVFQNFTTISKLVFLVKKYVTCDVINDVINNARNYFT